MSLFKFFRFQFTLLSLTCTFSRITSPNAVKTQIWIAVSIYLLVAILKKRLHLPGSLHTILQILEVNIFEKRPIIQIVKNAYKQESEPVLCNQLNLFNS